MVPAFFLSSMYSMKVRLLRVMGSLNWFLLREKATSASSFRISERLIQPRSPPDFSIPSSLNCFATSAKGSPFLRRERTLWTFCSGLAVLALF